MKKIIILNYSLSCIDVMQVPMSCETTEQVEERLQQMGYKLSQISWMEGDKDGTPVFYNDEECPAYNL